MKSTHMSSDHRPDRFIKPVRSLFLAACLLLPAAVVLAQAGGGYELTWSTVDAGGLTFSAGGGYTLGGTIGQPDAQLLTGGGYALAGGFWPGLAPAPPPRHVYLPLITRQSL
jgi:hypothetical protein